MPIEKYKPYPTVDLPDRQWPSRVLNAAPTWCSVDLRDGNQALNNPMSIEQKIEFFELLVALGFKEIEVGFPAASSVEYDFVRRLIEEERIPHDITIQVMTPSRIDLIDRTFQAVEGARRVILHFFNPTSPTQRRVVFNLDQRGTIELAVKAAHYVKKRAEDLRKTEVIYQYSPESSTATELEFTLEICEKVLDVLSPAPDRKAYINLPATVEMSTPNVFADRIEWFGRSIRRRDSIVLSVHTHNDRGTGVAATELALMAGAERVEGTLFGNGERTGNVDIVTIALNLFTQGVDPRLDFSQMDRVIAVYERSTGMRVPPRHPYCGALVYTAFSGSHQDAIRKAMIAKKTRASAYWDVPYLPMDPADIGWDYQGIIRINSQSGKGGVAHVMEEEFGYRLPKAMHHEFSQAVQRVSEETAREVSFSRVLECFRKEYLQVCGPFALKSCKVETKPGPDPGSRVTRLSAEATIYGTRRRLEGQGRGLIESLSSALHYGLDVDGEVIAFHEHALGRGPSHELVAYIALRLGVNLHFGVGQDRDIGPATLKAVFSALNRAFQAGHGQAEGATLSAFASGGCGS
jgi:2-isopropylmalate synthase